MIIDNLSGSVFHHYSSPAMCEKCNHDKQEVTCVRGCVRGLFPQTCTPTPTGPQVIPCVLLAVDCVDSRACGPVFVICCEVLVLPLVQAYPPQPHVDVSGGGKVRCDRTHVRRDWMTCREMTMKASLCSSCCVQFCKKSLGSGSCWIEDSKDLTPMRPLRSNSVGDLSLCFVLILSMRLLIPYWGQSVKHMFKWFVEQSFWARIGLCWKPVN